MLSKEGTQRTHRQRKNAILFRTGVVLIKRQ
jgi:hypothetical protein